LTEGSLSMSLMAGSAPFAGSASENIAPPNRPGRR
jgi:hypothetical protein